MRYSWSTNLLAMHLSYMPRKGTVNRCYGHLQKLQRLSRKRSHFYSNASEDFFTTLIPKMYHIDQFDVGQPTMWSAGTRRVPSLFNEQAGWHHSFRKIHWLEYPPEAGVPVLSLPGERPPLLVVHLFSGRRRGGDFHWDLQRLGDGCRLTSRSYPWTR